jgi:2-keto-4-pentenoate hydratase/2-oxohepta-3-ene-1,7-dioic acid hydratase in catechol pathway
MKPFWLATVETPQGPEAAVVQDGLVYPVESRPSLIGLFDDWERELDRLGDDLSGGRLRPGTRVEDTTFLPPVPSPPNLYMAGANYADHAREMRGLPPTAPIERPADGPFVFLKPTTTLIGHRSPVKLARDAEDVDWEVELAAVIGRKGRRIRAEDALGYVAGYTIVNDVSVRAGWMRAGAEPPLTWDWFLQKGWDTSCPCGPWLLPARFCRTPGDLSIALEVSGRVEQQSRTSELLFSVEELIEHISRVVPVVPGDVVSTGTCAGVGAGKGRFLVPGDVMVATIEGIGQLENPVVEDSAGGESEQP